MKTFLGLIFLLLIFSSCKTNKRTVAQKKTVIQSKFQELEGKTVGDFVTEVPEFKGYEEMGGVLIAPLKGEDYGIHQIKEGNKHIIIFEKVIPDGNKAKYQILDVLEIPEVKEQEYIVLNECRKDSIVDTEIIGLVLVEQQKEFFDKVIKAWKADRETQKIVPIEPKEIICANEGFGME